MRIIRSVSERFFIGGAVFRFQKSGHERGSVTEFLIPPSPLSMNYESEKNDTILLQTASIYENHLLDFPHSKKTPDFEDVPLFGSLPELLQSVWLHLGVDVRFVRNGATLPKDAYLTFSIGIRGGKSPGQLAVLKTRDIRKPKLSENEQKHFLTALAQFLGDAYRWQQTLRQNEENQTANIAVSPHSIPLFDLLKESAKLIDCCAASFYSLDSAQKMLKLRSCWGLPEERLLEPPKPLHESVADVEAILGQAVIVNEDYLFENWNVPEDFPTAVCLPVMSQQSILGTLWLYSDRQRDFTDHELNLMEYITGRLAAELERNALLIKQG